MSSMGDRRCTGRVLVRKPDVKSYLEDLGVDGKIILKWILTLRRLMSYIYGAPILDISRSHTTTHHSR